MSFGFSQYTMYFNPEIFNLCVQRCEVAHRVRYEREAPRRRMTARFRDAIAHGNTTSRA